MGEKRVGDDELGFEVGIGNEPTEADKKKRRREIDKCRISRCWEVLPPGPSAWSTPGTAGTPVMEREFADRRFRSLSLWEQRILLLMHALVSQPPF